MSTAPTSADTGIPYGTRLTESADEREPPEDGDGPGGGPTGREPGADGPVERAPARRAREDPIRQT